MRKLALILVALIVSIFVIPSFLPQKTEVEVEKVYGLSVEDLFEEFNNIKSLSKWEPWTKADSATIKKFTPPNRGVGGIYKWESLKPTVGNGSIKIEEVEDNEFIVYNLNFGGWEEDTELRTEFTVIDKNKTKVRWLFTGVQMPYLYRYYNLFLPHSIKQSLSKGLDNLEKNVKVKKIKQKQLGDEVAPSVIFEDDVEGLKLLVIEEESSLDQSEVSTAIAESLAKVRSYLLDVKKIDSDKVGLPTVYYKVWDKVNDKANLLIGLPIEKDVPLGEGMSFFVLPSGKVIVSVYQKGGSITKEETILNMRLYAEKNDIKLKFTHWEVSLNESTASDSLDLKTRIYIPIE